MQLKTSQGRRKSERRREKERGWKWERNVHKRPRKGEPEQGRKVSRESKKEREKQTKIERRNKNERRKRKRCELFQFVVSRPADPGSRIALWKVEEKDRKGYISDE